MDAIEALDWGAHADFTFKSGKYGAILPLMRGAGYVSSYVAIAILLLIALALFLAQGKLRSAVVALLSFTFAVGLIAVVRFLVPRLGPDGMAGSYPATSVLLFMLTMILIGFAVWNLSQRYWVRGCYAAVATILTVWVCLSQFFLALHFLTDILGALAGATAVSWIAFKFMDAPPAKADVSADQ